MKQVIVTGSSGLIGSEVSAYLHQHGFAVHGVDNNMRAVLFGPDGDNRPNQKRLVDELSNFTHHELDVRDRASVIRLMARVKPDLIVHTAAQPSHDLAARMPFDDFDINAGGTLNLLEAARQHCPDTPFVHMSTNKVYGDRPNHIALRESETRWEYDDLNYVDGIAETLSIDQSLHSPFGASKVAADLFVQEYGRYFDMPTCCLRAGCLTGPQHAGVELHGFLSYLVRCNVEEHPYKVFGYKGKQVRDNIHAHDVATFIHAFYAAPRRGEVYNLGGGRENACSILEAFALAESVSGKSMQWDYVNEARRGDHICYYSDLAKIKNHYPQWTIEHSLADIIASIVAVKAGRT